MVTQPVCLPLTLDHQRTGVSSSKTSFSQLPDRAAQGTGVCLSPLPGPEEKRVAPKPFPGLGPPREALDAVVKQRLPKEGLGPGAWQLRGPHQRRVWEWDEVPGVGDINLGGGGGSFTGLAVCQPYPQQIFRQVMEETWAQRSPVLRGLLPSAPRRATQTSCPRA